MLVLHLIELLVLHLLVLTHQVDLIVLIQSLLQMQEQDIQVVKLLQYLIQRQLVELELITLTKLFKVCVQELKQESRIGIMILKLSLIHI